jgi:hypothetical protein
MKIGKYKIPFSHAKGPASLLEYVSCKEGEVVASNVNTWHMPNEWRDNAPFEATIELTGQYRGRSAARVRVVNIKTKETYSLALGAFYECVVAFGADPGGRIKGTWVFRKQGSNYGLYPYTSDGTT